MKTIFVECQDQAVQQTEIREMYAIAAELHNEGLQELAKERGFERFSARQRFQAVLKFVQQAFPILHVKTLFSEAEFVKLDEKITAQISKGKPEALVSDLQKEGSITAVQANYLKLVYRILGAEKQENLYRAVRKLQGLKVELIARKDISDQEKGILFGALEIGMASARFWADAANDKDNAWHNANQTRVPVWLRDLGGFIVGGLVGGAIAGPAGAIAGGVLVGEAASGKYN